MGSRHVYLEFFVKYPSQDKYMYAKSPTTHIPPQVLQSEDHAFKKKKDKKEDGDDDDKRKQQQQQEEQKEVVLCTMKFDLKNVKLKIPKVPHQIFGRLMAKDDYFPTAVATFDFKVERGFLQDRRTMEAEEKLKEKGSKPDDGGRKEPELIGVPLTSSYKVSQPVTSAAGGGQGGQQQQVA